MELCKGVCLYRLTAQSAQPAQRLISLSSLSTAQCAQCSWQLIPLIMPSQFPNVQSVNGIMLAWRQANRNNT